MFCVAIPRIASSVILVFLAVALFAAQDVESQPTNPVVRAGYIYADAPFDYAHGSSMAETGGGLVATWYAGGGDGSTDVGIWLSRFGGTQWSRPRKIADYLGSNGAKVPCWNPVLFQPRGGPLLLFYRVGPNTREWFTVVRISADDGLTWSEAVRLPDGFLGPIRTKPVQLKNMDIVMGSSTEHDGWVAHIERFSFPEQSARTPVDQWINRLRSASSWFKTDPIHSIRSFAAIQPALFDHGDGLLQALCRTKQGVLSESWSSDGGATWSPMVSSGLPNPSSGIDGIRLRDGRFLLVSNPTAIGRSKLSVSLSDDGITWAEVFVLEDGTGESSYPAVLQTRDGSIHITYSVKPKWMKHVVLEPSSLDQFPPSASGTESDSLGFN